MQMIRHIVLINWKKDASPEQIDNLIRLCHRIPDECSMVYNWCSSRAIPNREPEKPSTHEFCIMFDLRSAADWDQYFQHPYPKLVLEEGIKIVDTDRTASTNMLVEAEPLRVKSQLLATSASA